MKEKNREEFHIPNVGIILLAGAVSAFISFIPHLLPRNPDLDFLSIFAIAHPSALFIPGFAFGVMCASLILFFRSGRASIVHIIIRSILIVLVSTLSYYIVRSYISTVLVVVWLPLNFFISGLAGALFVAMSIKKVLSFNKKAISILALWGGLLGFISAVPFMTFLIWEDGFPDVGNSRVSFALLYLIWQTGMLLAIYFSVRRKKRLDAVALEGSEPRVSGLGI